MITEYYYKVTDENGVITQLHKGPVLPDYAVEITKEEYDAFILEKRQYTIDISNYVTKVKSGEMTLEEIPEEYLEEVTEIVNIPDPEPTYTLDEAATLLAQEVNS